MHKTMQNQNQTLPIKFVKYRALGNCFVNCLIQALVNLGDKDMARKSRLELEVFDLETLYSRPENEFKPALNYLINKGYKVKIIDPEPYRDCNWSDNLAHVDLKIDNYTVEEVEALSNDGWQVIISTEAGRKPHAVLVTGEFIYNSLNESTWRQVCKKTEDLLLDYTNRKEERFLMAIKK